MASYTSGLEVSLNQQDSKASHFIFKEKNKSHYYSDDISDTTFEKVSVHNIILRNILLIKQKTTLWNVKNSSE